ncbi:MAG: LysM peptidoglycan-binding domain-containing protein [Acidimicrobiales bacterium]
MTALVVVGEVGTVAGLVRLGSVDGLEVRWGDLRGWLANTPTDDVLVAVARLLGLGVAMWLLASTALYLAASVLRLPGLVRTVGWATLPGVRRLVDAIVAGTIVASTLSTAGPALAQAPAPVAVHAYVPHPAGDGPPYVPVPAGETAPVTTATMAPPSEAAPLPPSEPAPVHANEDPSYRVEPGDNLWRIAERHLAQATNRAAGDLRADDVRPYWQRLVETNRVHLASGDPNLIYPGEVVVLPEVFDNR